MADRAPLARPRTEQLVQLMQALEVDFVNLTECLVSPGYRLALQGADVASVHYALEGEGRIVVEGQEPQNIRPHTLVIVPAGKAFRFEVDAGAKPLTTLDLEGAKVLAKDSFHRIEAGEGRPRMTLICGNFRCRHGSGQDLFGGLRTAVVEQFSPEDHIEEKMQEAFAELLKQEEGDGVMAAHLLKDVVVKLLRKSVASNGLWVERLSALQDPQIARAFAEMVSRPGHGHTSDSLAGTAGMSRSVFMDRFTKLFGQSPIAVLRHLRLSHAKTLLGKPAASIETVAREVGYTNRNSFNRAFKEEFDEEPSEYRARVRKPSIPESAAAVN